jgi:1-acyl-sn-glycerol-3-phosphate acyltransferase
VHAARRADAPIVPVAVVGAEEALPRLAGIATLGRLTRIPLMATVPLPAKLKIRFLEPVGADCRSRPQADKLAQDIRALVQENVFEMVAARRSVWLG